jgi:hypothetical protein
MKREADSGWRIGDGQITSVPLDRRTAIKWVLAASAALQLPVTLAAELASAVALKGYGKDPNLLDVYSPGKFWPLTLTEDQRRAATALSDVILPAEGEWPAASSVGVIAFVDEWISAPYSPMTSDRPLILEGLTWLDAESQRRFKARFADLSDAQKKRICDDICPGPQANPSFEIPTKFFSRYRTLIAAGYYTTPQGMRDLGYVGNVPLAKFDGPPKEVLKKLGLA